MGAIHQIITFLQICLTDIVLNHHGNRIILKNEVSQYVMWFMSKDILVKNIFFIFIRRYPPNEIEFFD